MVTLCADCGPSRKPTRTPSRRRAAQLAERPTNNMRESLQHPTPSLSSPLSPPPPYFTVTSLHAPPLQRKLPPLSNGGLAPPLHPPSPAPLRPRCLGAQRGGRPCARSAQAGTRPVRPGAGLLEPLQQPLRRLLRRRHLRPRGTRHGRLTARPWALRHPPARGRRAPAAPGVVPPLQRHQGAHTAGDWEAVRAHGSVPRREPSHRARACGDCRHG